MLNSIILAGNHGMRLKVTLENLEDSLNENPRASQFSMAYLATDGLKKLLSNYPERINYGFWTTEKKKEFAGMLNKTLLFGKWSIFDREVFDIFNFQEYRD